MKDQIIKILGFGILILAILGALMYFGIIDEYTTNILTQGGIAVIVALSLNLISGFTGQLALGQAGFMAIGAYTTAILVMRLQMPLYFAIPLGGLMTAFFGLLIGFPTLKLRGDYLAIVTLGFGEIIRSLLNNLGELTGGAAGLKGIPQFSEDMLFVSLISFVWVFLVMLVIILMISNLIKSSPGRALLSIREDEIAANSMGINVFYYKMFAFTLAAFVAGIGGGLYAIVFGYLSPKTFEFLKSCEFLIIVVLGGMGSIAGTVATGFILTYLQEFLRFLEDYRLVIYSLLLILMMLFKPAGLVGIIEDIKGWYRKLREGKTVNKGGEIR